jgi:hypothetical protein
VLRHLFLVVLAVEDVPLVGPLQHALLALQLPPHEGVDHLVRLHLALDHLDDLLADLAGVLEVLHPIVLVEVGHDEAREVQHALPAELHRMMPFFLASSRLTLLNMKE